MSWSSWESTWRLHATSRGFGRRLERAMADASELINKGRVFLSMSGGKDSVALAAVIHRAGIRPPCVAHAWSPLNTPGMERCAWDSADRFGLELDSREPDVIGSIQWHRLQAVNGKLPKSLADLVNSIRGNPTNVWELLEAIPTRYQITQDPAARLLKRITASGNMMVAFSYEHGFSGSWLGLRADESRGRLMNRIVRGTIYQSAVDGRWVCAPLADWSARDVYALITTGDWPLCPHYRLLSERLGIPPESPMSRVDCLITDDAIAARGAIAHIRVLYPEIWSRLSRTRPELVGLT